MRWVHPPGEACPESAPAPWSPTAKAPIHMPACCRHCFVVYELSFLLGPSISTNFLMVLILVVLSSSSSSLAQFLSLPSLTVTSASALAPVLTSIGWVLSSTGPPTTTLVPSSGVLHSAVSCALCTPQYTRRRRRGMTRIETSRKRPASNSAATTRSSVLVLPGHHGELWIPTGSHYRRSTLLGRFGMPLRKV